MAIPTPTRIKTPPPLEYDVTKRLGVLESYSAQDVRATVIKVEMDGNVKAALDDISNELDFQLSIDVELCVEDALQRLSDRNIVQDLIAA